MVGPGRAAGPECLGRPERVEGPDVDPGPMNVEADALARAFAEAFGAEPTHYAWAPGRVNLVGDHIDYHDLPVLPMALERGVHVVFRAVGGSRVRVANMEPHFEPVSFDASPAPVPAGAGHWGNYVRAGVAAIHGWAAQEFDGGVEGAGRSGGFDAVVTSSLPVAAGLSSSSALVVAFGLAALESLRPFVGPGRLAPEQMAALLAAGERYVGTAGGGMDQAASIGGVAGHALRIEFDPLAWQPVPLPPAWTVIVAHSGVRAEKSGASQADYNRLRREGERALACVADALGAPTAYRLLVRRPEAELASAAEGVLDHHMRAVFDHVVSEAGRVDRAWLALQSADGEAFGRIMDRSHASLTERCGVGHPALDELVATARAAGAWGARLTGAGFGGSIVALAEGSNTNAVLAALSERVEASRRQTTPRPGSTPSPVFRARAGQGACTGLL